MKNFSDFLNEGIVNESLGGYVGGLIGDLREFATETSGKSSNKITDKDKEALGKAVDDLEVIFRKTLKGKGFSGW